MKKIILIIAAVLVFITIFISGCVEKPITGVEWFQTGNTQQITKIQTKQSRELADNRIAGFWHGLWQPFDYQDILDNEISDPGLKRVRLAINELDWNMVDWDKPEFSIEPSHDRWITSIAENGVTITYVLSFWDKEYRAGGGEVSYPRFKTEDQIQRYLDFVRFIVHHFKDRVQYFEIWNEPNVRDSVQWIEVDDYIKLIERAVPIIRQEYPEAKIQVGGTTYLRETESRDYLFSILRSDIMPLVDVVSWHPMYGTSPEFDSEYYYEYPPIVQEIKDVASAHGFEGEYEADELAWYSIIEGTHWDGWSQRYSDTIAAKYYARGTMIHLGMDVTVGLGGVSEFRPKFYTTAKSLCTIMAGAEPIELPIEIQSEAENIKSYAFSLTNGDKLIALWTDGVAVDDDPGVKADLIFDGFSGKEVTAIDVLNGYTQSITVNRDKIQNLIVRDYPLIIQVKK